MAYPRSFYDFLRHLTWRSEKPFLGQVVSCLKDIQDHPAKEKGIETAENKVRVKIQSNQIKISSEHVHLLFDMIQINKKSLFDPSHQESVFRTWFYHKKVMKVQKIRNALVMSTKWTIPDIPLQNEELLLGSLQLSGNSVLQQIEKLIVQVRQKIKLLKFQNFKQWTKMDKDSVVGCLKQLDGEMFIYRFLDNKIAISNQLLLFLGYDVEEFAIETVKYRCVFFDFLFASSYPKIIVQYLRSLRMCFSLNDGQITEQQFLANNTLQFTDFIYSKNQNKSLCKIQFFVLPKLTTCIKIKQITVVDGDILNLHLQSSIEKQMAEYKNQRVQKQYRILNRMGHIPGNWLSGVGKKMAGFKRRPKIKSQCPKVIHKK